MPPIIPDTTSDVSKKPITVYLTGFGPFRSFTENPSWQIVSSFLPSASVSTDIYDITIIPHPAPVRVAYETIDTLIPSLHAEKKFDYILHIGVAVPGDYEIETVAHEKGYVKGDIDGLIPGGKKADSEKEKKNETGDTGKRAIEDTDGGQVYKTELDIERIIGMMDACGIVPEETPEKQLVFKESTNAGRYLCEYIYRTSLRCAEHSSRRVLFLHVPPEDDPYSIKTGVGMLEKFIIAFVTEGERLRRKQEKEL
ncbi:uncharacterized protein LAJ45_02455 [Morchella importuna]|uniref:uncharacterized protein n=1 Tax=Morchella importuna TaxID=1174673 RepID=UPI001E8EA3EC|nr:uncharacterized protein LAJ45_02455 [Morchella importuna]KAH8153642.1 hypothetical protein LAJ45_02455 [Morchella importuna]